MVIVFVKSNLYESNGCTAALYALDLLSNGHRCIQSISCYNKVVIAPTVANCLKSKNQLAMR